MRALEFLMNIQMASHLQLVLTVDPKFVYSYILFIIYISNVLKRSMKHKLPLLQGIKFLFGLGYILYISVLEIR